MTGFESGVLVLAPTPRDASVTHASLKAAGLDCAICADLRDLTRRLPLGTGAVLLTEESLIDAAIGDLVRCLRAQLPWSDIPIVLLMRGALGSNGAAAVLRALGNVTVLERPAPLRSVISALRAAVRARMRQYLLRDQIEQLRAADQDKRFLLAREQAARTEAERASRTKDEFLATLSHELRTPLNAILGWAHMLKADRGDPAVLDEGLDIIERNARVQAALIADLLDMNRIVSGKIRLDLQSIDPGDVLRAAVESVRPTASAKGVQVGVSLPAEALRCRSDPARLQQIVWNLITNAIKFTPPGGRIDVRLEPGEGQFEVIVSDNGEGIRPEFLPHVFERFRQADASTTRRHGGLGLGLAIVKQLAEMHGGTVRAASAGAGRGSTFTVTLPASLAPADRSTESPANDQTASPLEPAVLHGVRILVVDDERDARTLMKRVLQRCDADVRTADSATGALQQLDQWHPDIIVTDIGMPHLDGYELLKAARARGVQAPAVAVTAFARADDQARARQAGFTEHLAKPIEPDRLITTLTSIIHRRRSNP